MLRPPDDARIPVATPRSRRHERPPKRRATDATGAGPTLIVVIALFAVGGDYAGRQFGAATSGAIVGGFVGLLSGFAAIYLRYRDL
ncbi:MAG: hypothetical protein QOF86_492 [Baekduia sp.]|nr:hypothetical protein [Baekduia sp.]